MADEYTYTPSYDDYGQYTPVNYYDPNQYYNPFGNNNGSGGQGGGYDPRLDPGAPAPGNQYGGGGPVSQAPSAGGGYLDAAGKFIGAIAPAAGQMAQGYFQNQAGKQNSQAAQDQTNRIIADQHRTEQFNRPDQHDPFQDVKWEQDPQTGKWTQNVTLNQADQANLDASRGITAARLGAAGGIDLSMYKKMPDFESIGLGALAKAAGLDPNGKSNSANLGGDMIAGHVNTPYISPADPAAMKNNIGMTLDNQGRIIRG
jgi:hypothetical protein